MIEAVLNLDLPTLIKSIGYIGVTAVVFVESGLFFGFFLPGDTLLFTAGLLASQGYFSIVPLTIMISVSAVAGDQVGYWFGRKVGPKIFTKDDSLFFKKRYVNDAEKFYEKHGKSAVIIARFIPVVRTFIPILAGVGRMHYNTFITYNIIGGIFWGAGVTLAGYFLGNIIPGIDQYLLPILFIIIIVSILPTIISILKEKYKNRP